MERRAFYDAITAGELEQPREGLFAVLALVALLTRLAELYHVGIMLLLLQMLFEAEAFARPDEEVAVNVRLQQVDRRIPAVQRDTSVNLRRGVVQAFF